MFLWIFFISGLQKVIADTCNEQDKCIELVDGHSISPKKNNYLRCVNASATYRISVDLLCDTSLKNDETFNIIRVSRGTEFDGYSGHQIFNINRHWYGSNPYRQNLQINVFDPQSNSYVTSKNVVCTQTGALHISVLTSESQKGLF